VCIYRKATLNSRVVSLSINDMRDEPLNPPVSIILQHNNPVRLAVTIAITIVARKKGTKDTHIRRKAWPQTVLR